MVDLDNLEESIVTIYRQHYLDVYRFLICFTGNRNDAEDLTQDVFIRVLHNLHKYQNGSLKTWIFSIAKNIAIDHYRKKKYTSIITEGFFTKLVSSQKEPNDVVEENELKEIIHGAVSRLKPNYRSVVILRGINEFSIKETAEILQCSESKVKVDYHRALKMLQKGFNFDDEGVMYSE